MPGSPRTAAPPATPQPSASAAVVTGSGPMAMRRTTSPSPVDIQSEPASETAITAAANTTPPEAPDTIARGIDDAVRPSLRNPITMAAAGTATNSHPTMGIDDVGGPASTAEFGEQPCRRVGAARDAVETEQVARGAIGSQRHASAHRRGEHPHRLVGDQSAWCPMYRAARCDPPDHISGNNARGLRPGAANQQADEHRPLAQTKASRPARTARAGAWCHEAVQTPASTPATSAIAAGIRNPSMPVP